MIQIEEQGNGILFNGNLTDKQGWVLSPSSDQTKVVLTNRITGLSGSSAVTEVEVDGSTFADYDALVAALGSVLFKSSGTGSDGVQSVTGDGVGGSESDVVLSFPTPGDIGAATAEQGAKADSALQQSDTSDVADAGKVVKYSNIGAVNTATPQFPENAVPLSYFDAGLSTKQDVLSNPSQLEAESGTATTARSWTAQRDRQGIIGASRIIVSVSGSKTLVLTDEYTFQNVTAASTVTVPTNASAAIPIGAQIDFFQAGSGVITFAAASGVTIISKGGTLATTEAGDAATLKKTSTNTWALIIAG